MTHCYNCGHTGTFVLLAQFALAVPGPDATVGDRADSDVPRRDRPGHARTDPDRPDPGRTDPDRTEFGRTDPGRSDPGRTDPRRTDPGRKDPCSHTGRGRRPGRSGDPREDASRRRDPLGDDRRVQFGNLPTRGDLSLAVQCPVCDSTDVGVAAVELLARYGSSTTS